MHHSSQGMYKRNILFRSLNIEVFKSTLGILAILFMLVVGSRLIGYFEQSAEGLIDPNIIYKVVALRFPDFVTLLIPLSFFLGLVITISRLYSDREIYGYISGGLSPIDLIRYLIPQSLLFFLITLVLSIYVAPYTKELSKEIISVDTIQEKLASIKPKELILFDDDGSFIYIEDKENSSFDKVIVFDGSDDKSSLVRASRLKYFETESSIELNFENGSMYQNIFNKDSSVITQFGELKIPAGKEVTILKGLSFSKLFDFSLKSSKSQMQWNISVPLTIFIFLLLAVSLSKVQPRQGRLSVVLPSIFIYILYLSLLILARDSSKDDIVISSDYIWFVHLFFLILGFFLLLKEQSNFELDLKNILKINIFSKVILGFLFGLLSLWIFR
tara:strand:- start:1783 stop:2943 length:1161 start_codon:yes stop_codon:yes gene_type:complete